ncbi:MAG: prepilin peptidase [Verrucomicrobia bacterium]|nr:prepilin peptidase [Verrucomicrobiota bacterium]
MIPSLILSSAVFVLGACVGSFLNVCILRVPLGQSIVRPRSRCPACGLELPGFLNLPILGYCMLRGRARCCGAHLDPRYPLVELGTALAFTALWQLYPAPLFLVYATLTAGLVVASGIDLDYLVIPDSLTVGGVVTGICASYFLPELQNCQNSTDAMIRSVLGAAMGGGILWITAKAASWLLQKEAMGIGDAKLLAGLGAFLGWPSLPFILVVSSFTGTLVGMVALKSRKRKLGVKIPYGPFLAWAAFLWLLIGDWMMQKVFLKISFE